MSLNSETMLHQTFETMNQIRDSIYGCLNGEPFTKEALARALSPYFGQKSEKELCHDIALLEQGLEQGKQDFDQLNRMDDEELEGCFARQLEGCMEKLSDAEQRQYLLVLAQVILTDSGLSVDGPLAIYLSHLSTPDLKLRVSDLLKNASCHSVAEIGQMLTETREKIGNTKQPKQTSAYSAEETDLIEAAVTYAASQSVRGKVISAVDVGRGVGVQRSMLRQAADHAGEWLRLNGKALLVRALMILSVIAAGVLLWQVLAAFGGAAEVWKKILALLPNGSQKFAIPVLACALAEGMNQLINPILDQYPIRAVCHEMQQTRDVKGLYKRLRDEARQFTEANGYQELEGTDEQEDTTDFELPFGFETTPQIEQPAIYPDVEYP